MDKVLRSPSSNPKKKRTTIALFRSGSSLNYETLLQDAAVRAAREQAINLVTYCGGEIESTIDDRVDFNVLYNLATQHNMDALVLLTLTLRLFTDTRKMVSFIEKYGVPTVSMEYKLPDTPAVLVRYEPGMRAVIRHLIDVHGLRRIAFIDGPSFFTDQEPGMIRFQAYLDVLAEYGIP